LRIYQPSAAYVPYEILVVLTPEKHDSTSIRTASSKLHLGPHLSLIEQVAAFYVNTAVRSKGTDYHTAKMGQSVSWLSNLIWAKKEIRILILGLVSYLGAGRGANGDLTPLLHD
jgi:hypothetical protein